MKILGFGIWKYKWGSTPDIGLGFSSRNHIILGLPGNIKIWLPLVRVPEFIPQWYYRKFSK